MATPDWVFRVIGAGIFLAFIALEVKFFLHEAGKKPGGFREAFWSIDRFWVLADQTRLNLLIYGRVLVILTFVIIALSFILRTAPIKRASTPREIIIPLIAALWPMYPYLIKNIWLEFDPVGGKEYSNLLFDNGMSFHRFVAGSALVVIGNALDVWAYAYLCRSLSVVAEARELKVTGPYRVVRHPVYLGQILAQCGMWIFFAQTKWYWIAFLACFIAMQLYRSKVEDEVLEQAFGDRYREWKRKTLWFF
jgi:protein-S-isoprenylcysteine O-methyltransferase Ste14